VFPSAFDDRFATAIRAHNRLVRVGEITPSQFTCMARAARGHFKRDFQNKDLTVICKLPWYDVFDVPYHRADYLRHVDLNAKPTVRVSTIHSAKGMEADNIILINAMGARTVESADTDEEHRTWYVAVTRARENLIVVEGDNPYDLPIQET